MKIGLTNIVSCKIGSTQVNRVYIGSTLIWSYSAFDPDAQLFITNAAITNPTQKSAIDKLVVDLKGYGIWSKMKAIYPFCGGTAAQHKFNLRNPVDSDSAFRLVFNGGWTHSSTGALPNGTNAWANTWFKSGINFTSKDNAHYSFYSRTDLASAGIDIGADESPSNHALYTRSTSNTAIFLLNGGTYPNVAVANSLGFYTANRNAVNTINAWKNGSKLNEMASTSAVATGAFMAISAYNNAINAPQYYSAKQAAFASFGDGLTDTEAANYYTAVQAFQTSLGRQVGVPIVSDLDAQAFLNAAVITDTTQASAVNTLVTNLKGYGIWTKMKALYPFVGGTAETHKWNLKNPVNSDAAFRLVFNGGWVHSSTGALPNGVNAYADTFFKPSNWTNTDDSNMSYYSRTTNSELKYEIGLFINSINSNSNNSLGLKYIGNYEGAINSSSNNSLIQFTNADSRGFYFINRNIANKQSNWKNGNKVGEVLVASSYNPDPLNYVISAYNINGSIGYFSSKECAFSPFGDGLTDTEAANYYTAVQAFQTSLNRQVV